jgi:hypothetical protein
MDIKVGRNNLMDSFELDEIGTFLKEDNLDAVKDRYLTQEHSEICAYYGANKCLSHMVSHSMTLSPLVNLYAIEHGHKLSVNVPHDDEMYMLIIRRRLDDIRHITLPSVDTSISTFYELSVDISVDYKEAFAFIRSLYTDELWKNMSQESIVKLVELDLSKYITGEITQKTFRSIARSGLLDIFEKSGQPYKNALAKYGKK